MTEAAKEVVAHVVDGIGGAEDGGDENVPEKPAADGAEDGNAVCDCFGVRFDEST